MDIGAGGGTAGSAVIPQIPLNTPKFASFDPKAARQGVGYCARGGIWVFLGTFIAPTMIRIWFKPGLTCPYQHLG